MPDRRLRVLLASPLPPPDGGIASWSVRLLAAAAPDDIDRIHIDTAVHLRYHYAARIGFTRLSRQARVLLRSLWACWRLRPDVMHVTTSYDAAFTKDALLLQAGWLVGASTILNIHGGDFQRFFEEQSERRQVGIRAVLDRCACVVPVTQETAGFLTRLGLSNVHVVPNCVEIRRGDARATSGRPSRWLFVGWIMPAKGVSELLEALSAFPEATVTLVGPFVDERGERSDRWLAGELDRLSIRQRVRHVTGLEREAVRGIYREHDLFVFPTRREGFPNVVLEAMEAGLPIVATRVGGIPDMIEHEREGLLVPPRDGRALVEAIRRVGDEPGLAARLGRAARERARQMYSVEQVAARWHDLYRQVARRTNEAAERER